jgi:HEAT repeat protein
VRTGAAWALGKLGDPRAVEPLIETLNDPKPRVRKDAAWALGRLGDDRAASPLNNLLQDKDDDVRQAVKTALDALKKRSTGKNTETT